MTSQMGISPGRPAPIVERYASVGRRGQLGAFTTLQPTRLQAARPGVELLTTIQAIIGIALAGLLGFVAGNRIRRS